MSRALINADLRNRCQQVGEPSDIQGSIIGANVVVVVALDRGGDTRGLGVQ